jgi:pimeloyl-ACP methyl ester carboxylesterase
MVILILLNRLFALISLAILAAGLWLAFEWWDRWRDVRDALGPLAAEDLPRTQLYVAIALLAWSFLGRAVVLGLLGRSGGDRGRKARGGERLQVVGADGSALAVEAYGPKSAPAILLTHGWGLDSTTFYEAKQTLTDRYRVVVWDLPGLGRSGQPADRRYSVEGLADDLTKVIEAVAPAQVLLVGHSIGGMIVQTLARRRPDGVGGRVVGAALFNTTDVNPLRTMAGRPVWEALRRPFIEPLMRLDIILSPLLWLMNWQSYLSGSTHLAFRIVGFGRRPTRAQLDQAALLAARHSPAVQAKGNLAMFHWEAGAGASAAELPTLVFVGGRDIITLPEAGERIAQKAQGELVRAPAAGHMGPVECADTYNARLLAFADQVLGGQTQAAGQGIPASQVYRSEPRSFDDRRDQRPSA